jgi:peptidyl-prolyl cis-trans isomerase SurA
MRGRHTIPIPGKSLLALVQGTLLAAVLRGPCAVYGQLPQTAGPAVLDRVVAVVNRHVILTSDLDDEIRLSVLDPDSAGHTLTRQRALEQLVSRTLIEQQIREEDAQAAAPTEEQMHARLSEIRKELPACVREGCATEEGWEAFLVAHDLTTERVEAYLRYRLEILRFIELRFRQGIRISQQEIANYYQETLLPQYRKGEKVPSLEQVAPRIEEILLQQQVNALFDDWLDNLRKEGDVEVLDPSLESSQAPAAPTGDLQ